MNRNQSYSHRDRLLNAPAVRFLYAGAVAARTLAPYTLLARRRRGIAPQDYASRLERLHAEGAHRLYEAVLQLQGLMIKIGQTIGSRPDVFPEAYTSVLSRLQDRVPPRPWAEMRPHIEKQLGAPVNAVFAEFDTVPVAAASLAQVYRARLKDGREVAVKVVYPAIIRLVRTDLRILRMLIWLESRVQNYQLQPVYEELAASIPNEVDMFHEAQNMRALAGALAHRSDVLIPEVIQDYTRKRVLVMEYVHGVKVSDLDGLRTAGIQPELVFELLTDVYFEQMFRHGLFHADPHPGNLLGLPGNRLAILDFGLVKRFTPEFRSSFAKSTHGMFTGNDEMMVEAMQEMGFDFGGTTEPFLAVGDFFRTMSDPATYRDRDLVAAANQAWGDAMRRYRIQQMPGDIVLPMRVFGLLFGFGASVGAGVDMGPGVIRERILHHTRSANGARFFPPEALSSDGAVVFGEPA